MVGRVLGQLFPWQQRTGERTAQLPHSANGRAAADPNLHIRCRTADRRAARCADCITCRRDRRQRLRCRRGQTGRADGNGTAESRRMTRAQRASCAATPTVSPASRPSRGAAARRTRRFETPPAASRRQPHRRGPLTRPHQQRRRNARVPDYRRISSILAVGPAGGRRRGQRATIPGGNQQEVWAGLRGSLRPHLGRSARKAGDKPVAPRHPAPLGRRPRRRAGG
jgi:hypothetical protein